MTDCIQELKKLDWARMKARLQALEEKGIQIRGLINWGPGRYGLELEEVCWEQQKGGPDVVQERDGGVALIWL